MSKELYVFFFKKKKINEGERDQYNHVGQQINF